MFNVIFPVKNIRFFLFDVAQQLMNDKVKLFVNTIYIIVYPFHIVHRKVPRRRERVKLADQVFYLLRRSVQRFRLIEPFDDFSYQIGQALP
jgi:hypothetical protein